MTRRTYYQQMFLGPETKVVLLEESLLDAMYELFMQIGVFWKNAPERSDMRSELYTFMTNRISLDGNYEYEYANAMKVLDAFKQTHATIEEAYAAFFTDPEGLETPPQSRLAHARQLVSNEFISFQMSVGGFKAFGAENYPGYINKAYIEGKPAPYRTK